MRRCWIGFLVSFVLGSSHSTENLSFIPVYAQVKQVILAFFMFLFAFSSCILFVNKRVTCYAIRPSLICETSFSS
jgi:hypothetical protein